MLTQLTVGWLARFALDIGQGAAVVAYAGTQVLLLLYSSHRYLTLARVWRSRSRLRPPEMPAERDWPVVTVQLPVYNERVVVERLIEAAVGLRYPAHRIEIQVLDDSTDDTTDIAERAVARHRAAGHDVRLLHRASRDGYKAGALAAGLECARGELIAVFDADFVPPPEFLERLAPRFEDPRIGMVQARWGHLNRDASRLTAAQACMLDAHFLLEHAARMGRGLFFNFNGTAGLWRRACIEDAGGWAHDTLTEDLDLSYRAQLRGWRFDYDADVVARAELPADLSALRTQQHRWAKGSIQTARKLLPRLLAGAYPAEVKLEAVAHLTSNVSYPLVLLVGLLLGPVLLRASTLPPWAVLAIQAGSLALGVLPVALFLIAGQRLAGRGWGNIARDVPMALLLGAGLSLTHTRAVLEGLGSSLGEWRRTPKTGEGWAPSSAAPYARHTDNTDGVERALAVYFTGFALTLAVASRFAALPFVALMAVGFVYVGFRDHPWSRRIGAPRRTRIGSGIRSG